MIIDSHMHLDNVRRHHPERIRWMVDREIVPVSWAFGDGIDDAGSLKEHLATQAEVICRMNRDGVRCFFLTGIHPRNIPPDLDPGAIEEMVLPHLENPLCLGIGEIGLETGEAGEVEIFNAQLALGDRVAALGKKIGIHTPRGKKSDITGKILEILEGYPELKGRVVVDHCSSETIDLVLRRGHLAGVTLSPVKTSLSELQGIVRRHAERLDRIMCNTDSGTDFYEDLYHAAVSTDIDAVVRAQVTCLTASAFWGIHGGAGKTKAG